MSDARRIVIEFIGEDKSLGRTVDQAESKTSRLGSTLKNVGKMAGLALAAGAVVAGKALYDMTKGAIEDQAAQQRLALALKNTTGASDQQIAKVEDWISAQGRLLGVTDDEMRPALQRLAESTGSVSKAQRQLKLAMDVSAGTGKSLETVTTALMKANNGSVSGLSRLGVATKNAKGETLSLEQITRKLGDTFGGQAAEKANTLEGKMARLRLIFDETKETIGAKLIPIVTVVADWFLNVAVPAIDRFGGTVRGVFSKVSGDVGGPMQDVKDIIASVVSIATSLWRAFGADIIRYAKAAWTNVRMILGGLLKVVSGIFKLIAAVLKGDWRGAWEAVKQILRGAVQVLYGILRQAGNALRLILSAAWTALKAATRAAWDGIKAYIRWSIESWLDLVRAIPGKIRAFGGLMLQAGKDLIGKFVDGMKNAAGVVGGIAGNVWDAVKGMINGAIDRLNAALSFSISLPGPDIHIDTNIPHLARGGIVRARQGGTLALLGEAGHDEAVVPLSGPYAGAVGGTSVVVLQLDSREIWRGLLRQRRLEGKGLGLG